MTNPYAPPRAEYDATHQLGKRHQFRRSPIVVPTLLTLLWINVAVQLGAVGFLLVDVAVYGVYGESYYEAPPMVLVVAPLAFLVALAVSFWATAIFFGIWLYRANVNACALGATDLGFSPGWSVGWFFVPFANLFMPYKAVSAIERASRLDVQGFDWMNRDASALVGWWWGVWILANFVSRVATRMARDDGPSMAIPTSLVGILSGCLAIAVSIFAIKLVRHIHGLQLEKHAKQMRSEAALTVSSGSNQFTDRNI